MTFAAYIGTIHEEIYALAWRIHRLPTDVCVVAWIDDDAQVHAAAVESAPDVPPDKLIGTYGPGRTVPIIEEDLRAVLREHRRRMGGADTSSG